MIYTCDKCNDEIAEMGAICKCGRSSLVFRDGEVKVWINTNVAPEEKEKEIEEPDMGRDQLMQLLLDQVNHSANLPPHVRHAFVTYLDFEAMILLIYSILKKSQ